MRSTYHDENGEEEPIVHASAYSEAAQNVYLPTDDVTVTIDPMNRQHWIWDGTGFDAYRRSVQRGLEFDKRAYDSSLNWYKAGHEMINVFLPTTYMIDKMDKFAAPIGQECMGWAGHKRDPSRFGKLPALEQALYDGRFINKSHGEIEHEMREADRHAGGRLFDRNGICR